MADYTPHVWADDEGGGVPIDAATLNEMEQGIDRASIPTKVTSLPGTPFDGQEVYLEAAGSVVGVYWHLRYRSASASSYKWEYLGGPPITTEILTSETTASTSFTNLATPGPSGTVPLAGEYKVAFGVQCRNDTAPNGCFAAPALGTAAAQTADAVRMASGVNAAAQTPARSFVREITTAGGTITLQYATTGTGTGTYLNRWIEITPIRVS